MKVPVWLIFSSQSHIQSMEPPSQSTLMTIINAEFSSKREWVNKLRLIHWETNSKVMSSESPVVMMVTDLP